MDYKNILKEICIGDLQEQHRALAEAIGIEAVIKLSDYCGGTQIYVPMVYELVKDVICKKIRDEFDGNNMQSLAIKYKVSQATVYRLVKEQIAEAKRSPMEGQMTLF